MSSSTMKAPHTPEAMSQFFRLTYGFSAAAPLAGAGGAGEATVIAVEEGAEKEDDEEDEEEEDDDAPDEAEAEDMTEERGREES